MPPGRSKRTSRNAPCRGSSRRRRSLRESRLPRRLPGLRLQQHGERCRNVQPVYDTRTPAPQATARAAVEWPEPTPTELPAGTVAAVQPAHRTPVESCAATPPTTADAAPPEAAEPPDLDRLGDQIARLSARIDAATYDLLCHLHQFDRHHGWEGFRSCAHWLNWRTGLDLGAAREKLRVAAALADLNHIAAALPCATPEQLRRFDT